MTLSISKVDHSKIEDFKKDLRILAIKSAKEKAEYLTLSIGNQIGKPLIIYENAPIFYQKNMGYIPNRSEDMMTAGTAESSEPEITFQKIKLEASVFVKFEVK